MYVSDSLLQSDVSGRKEQIHRVSVNTTQRMLFSGIHPANNGTVRTQEEEEAKERMGFFLST